MPLWLNAASNLALVFNGWFDSGIELSAHELKSLDD